MTRSILLSMFSLGVLAIGGALSPAAAGDVRVGIHFGGPPVVVAPPPVYAVPAAPVVIAPGTPIYYYGASYYTLHNGAWFATPSYGSPWAYVPAPRVPRPIYGVPRAHYRIPHHNAAHFAGHHKWNQGHRHGHGPDKHHQRHHRHHRDRD